MVIAYPYKKGLYLNITNRCTNNCRFCLRKSVDGIGGYNLWLSKEPSVAEIIEAVRREMTPQIEEVVFCGYGEPLIRLDVVLAVADFVKKTFQVPVRLNTNGLGNMIHGRNVAPELKGLVDTISVSLNAESGEKYRELCFPEFGGKSYAAVIDFINECKKYIPRVIASVVAFPGVDVSECKKIADHLGVEFRVREYF